MRFRFGMTTRRFATEPPTVIPKQSEESDWKYPVTVQCQKPLNYAPSRVTHRHVINGWVRSDSSLRFGMTTTRPATELLPVIPGETMKSGSGTNTEQSRVQLESVNEEKYP